MPSNLVKSLARKTGRSIKELEELWTQAKEITRSEGIVESDKDNFYKYAVGVFKQSLGKDKIHIGEKE